MAILVKDAFLEHSIMQSEWLDAETKAASAQKMEALRLAIAYPDYLVDDVKLNQLYRNFPNRSLDSFAANLLQYSLANTRTMIEDWAARTVDKDIWDMSPHETNAFYDQNRNMIAMLGAILSGPPMFQQDVPQYVAHVRKGSDI